VRHVFVGRGLPGVRGQELERRARVLRDEFDEPAFERRLHQLSGAEAELPLDREPAALECLRVDLAQDHALGEVERGDGDGAVLERRRIARHSRPAGNAHEHDHDDCRGARPHGAGLVSHRPGEH
jgi:hypothetical protein